MFLLLYSNKINKKNDNAIVMNVVNIIIESFLSTPGFTLVFLIPPPP